MRIVVNRIVMAAVVTLIGGLAPNAVAQPTPLHPFFVAHRLVEAEVSKVDHDAGALFLKTQAGRLKLDVPVEAMMGLRKGRHVLLDLTVIRHPDPAGLPRDDERRRVLLVQRLQAEITAIQHGIGVVLLTSSVGRLNIDLPETAIAGLRTGDRLTLELGFGSETGVSVSPGQPRQPRRARRVPLRHFRTLQIGGVVLTGVVLRHGRWPPSRATELQSQSCKAGAGILASQRRSLTCPRDGVSAKDTSYGAWEHGARLLARGLAK